ncbi:hypothetical protein [Maricurvus nonylphenolicus]|uniref:hypothetical protein n=1 Tax=Maricurvus nonylphenolicus TaxID=1008307 RepID=UPI0036F2C061
MMALQRISYQDARPQMKPGDVIAFAGRSSLSKIIRMVTMSNITHVGTILKSQVGPMELNQIVESTEVNGFCGVNISRFSDRLDAYDGEVFWLPVRKDLPFDADKFFTFLFDKAEKKHKWDALQALKSGFDFLDDIPGFDIFTKNKEDMSKIYCSELVAAGFEAAGSIPNINCSEVTPIELCRWNIFEDNYYVLNESVADGTPDEDLTISRFNSAAPDAWGCKL